MEQPAGRATLDTEEDRTMMQWTVSSLANELRELPGWARQERVTRVLVKEPEVRLVLVGLPAGARWPQHKAASRVIVSIVQGRLEFSVGGDARTLAAGDVISLEPSVIHDLLAGEDTFFLLTVAGPSGPTQIG
jgi:quercetin dioxygenase-like cupin family protein